MPLTTAERQARHRARQAQGRAQAQAEGATILATLEALTRAVEGLSREVEAMRRAGGYAPKNGGKPAPSVTSRGQNRDGLSRNGEGAPARAHTGGLPPYGGSRPLPDVTEDAHRVLVTLTRPASAGGIVDALGAMGRDLSRARVTTALVYLQDHGQVLRHPGEGAAPDVWEAVSDPTLEDLAGPSPRPLSIDQGPDLHVACEDYQAHTANHHWDPALGRFQCSECDPPTMAPAPVPPRAGAASSVTQEVVHA